MTKDILFAIWFFLPAGVANAAPVIFKKLPFFRNIKAPMDFGKHFRDKRVFGPNKTWLGPLSGVIVATAIVIIEHLLHKNSSMVRNLIAYDYCQLRVLWLGPLLGLGALFGDAFESFFKRQFNVKPGKSWFPFDQLDYIFGGLLASLLIVRLSLEQYLLIIIFWFAAHLVGSYIGYKLGLKETAI
jgi:CDP-2,3-bis-(O-geranylgeranyl)-sn-glycerol synthase